MKQLHQTILYLTFFSVIPCYTLYSYIKINNARTYIGGTTLSADEYTRKVTGVHYQTQNLLSEPPQPAAKIESVFLDNAPKASNGVTYSTPNLVHVYKIDAKAISDLNIKFIEIDRNLFNVDNDKQEDTLYTFYKEDNNFFIKSNFQRSIERKTMSFYDTKGKNFNVNITNTYRFSSYHEFVKNNLWGDNKKSNIKNSNGKLKIVPPVSAKKFEYKFNRAIPNNFKITMELKNISIKKSLEFKIIINGYLHISIKDDSLWINKERLKFNRYNELSMHNLVIKKEKSNIVVSFDDKTKTFVNVISHEQTWPSLAIVIERAKEGLSEEEIEQRSFELHSLEIEEAV